MSHERIIPVYSFNSNYIPSSECSTSVRPSRAPSESEDGPSYIAGKLSEVTSSSGIVVTVDLLLKSLQQSGLPGPVILVGRRTFLGQGAQFTVHEETMAWPEFDHFSTRIVATKQPMFALKPNLRVNMAEPHVQANLRDVYLEILALTDPALRMHPNVVRLLAWSFEPSSFHAPFNLVMEIASCNLSRFISNAGVDLSLRMKYWLCRDVGAGLDALHECGIVHGDIKPDNILIFGEGNRAVAKIADFGGSVYEDLSDNSRIRLGGTLGWQAPEVEENKTIAPAQLPKTDNYSFGLLIWGVLLNDGKVPCRIEGEHRQITYNREMETKSQEIGLQPGSFIREAAFVLLHQEPDDRPFDVKNLFGDITPEASPTKSPLSHPAFGTDLVIESLEDASRNDSVKGRYLSWELPAFAYHFLDDLYSRFMQDSRSVPADVLFSMYLAYTHTISRKAGPSNQALDVLVASALNGYEPAQATVTDAYEFYRLDPPEEVKAHLLDWLERATASGSIQAKRRLQNLDLAAVCRSMKDFRTLGGYNRIYSTIDHSKNGLEQQPGVGYGALHWLSCYGTFDELVEYLDQNRVCDIDQVTENDETALYLACARGASKIVLELLRRGASPRVKCTYFEISCIHWLFAFDEESQKDVLEALINHGGNIDAKSREVPFLHYPFILPAGSSLHWAVVTSSYETTRNLIEFGADLLLRDGSDPYIYDDRVRILNKFGGPNQEAFSFSEIGTRGLSPLDHVAMQHDPFVFELLVSLSRNVDINASDEEGFTVLHRLSTTFEKRTRFGNTFSALPFKGDQDKNKDYLGRTVAAIQALGANIEQLTNSAASRAQKAQRGWDFPSRTPLMMAFLTPSTTVMKELLKLGASVHTENDKRETALHCFPDDKLPCIEGVRLLVDHGANVNHRNLSGAAPILKAAQFGLLDVVDFLLSEGADIDERQSSQALVTGGSNLFAFLAYEDPTWRFDTDCEVLKVLEAHLFTCVDHEKKKRVLERGSDQGETLLHRFASKAMPRCVEGLILNGAPVDALHYKYRREREGDHYIQESWCETPLDAAVKTGGWRVKYMTEERRWPRSEYKDLERRDKEVIEIIKRAGGKPAPTEAVRSRFDFDSSMLSGQEMAGELLKEP